MVPKHTGILFNIDKADGRSQVKDMGIISITIYVILFNLAKIELFKLFELSELSELPKLIYEKIKLINILQILTIFSLIYINIIYKFLTIVVLFLKKNYI